MYQYIKMYYNNKIQEQYTFYLLYLNHLLGFRGVDIFGCSNIEKINKCWDVNITTIIQINMG